MTIGEMIGEAAKTPGETHSFEDGYYLGILLPEIPVTITSSGWKTWGKSVDRIYGQSFGWNFSNYGQSYSWHDWNGPLMRWLIPDKISIGLGAELTLFGGFGVQPINFSILTRGKERGIYYTPNYSVNAGGGSYFSAGFELSVSRFNGNPENITSNMLSGATHGFMGTGGALGIFSAGGSYSPVTDDIRFNNISVGAGVGVGVFGGYQYQNTLGSIPIWRW